KLVSVLVEEGGTLSAVNTFPNKNLELGTYLFNGCTALTGFTIPSAQRVVPSYMFRCCDSMTSVEILSGAGYSEGMFQGAMFESFTLTNANIPAYMFDGCTNLKTIVGKYTIVGNYAFRNTGFTSLDLSSVSSFGSYAFYGCKDLVTATIKNPSQYIFAECSSLQAVYLNGTTSIGNYAFYNCTALKEVNVPKAQAPSTEREGEVIGTRIVSTLPATITSVGQYAFANTAIEEIILSSSMNSVAAYTFNGCANLVRIELSAKVNTIAEYAFQNCVNLSIVTYTGYAGERTFALPANCVFSKPYYTFYNTAITEAYYKVGTTSGQYTFAECKNLKYAEMLGGQNAGTGTFMNCTALETIILPDTLYGYSYVSLHHKFAYNCSSLTSIDVGNVNHFASQCLFGCSSLEEFQIPSDTIHIEHLAFAFTGLKQVMIPKTIDGTLLVNRNTRFLYQDAFYGCDQLTMIACDEQNPVFRSIDGVLYLKEHEIVWIYPAGKEGAVAFYEENELFNQLDTAPRVAATTVGGSNASGSQAGNPVYIIAQSFSGHQFTDVVVPEGIQTLKGRLMGDSDVGGVFGHMTYMKTISLPSTLRTIEVGAFAYCTALESIVIPEGITAIPSSAFIGCTSLKSVTLPSTLESIGSDAFKDCTSLDTINWPDSLLEIGNEAFANTAIKSFTLPKNMTSLVSMNGNNMQLNVEMGLFRNCTQLTEVILHDKLTVLGGGIFVGCTNLKSLELPASLTTIGQGVFNGTGITEATIPANMTKGNEKWQRAFAGNTTITKVTIPEGIYKIPAYAFDGCTALTTVVLPSTLRVIGEGAFCGCTSLTSLFPNGVTPANIKLIERYAFEGCTAMTNIYIASNTVLGVGVFKGWTNKQTVNFVDDEIKVNALALIEGMWVCAQCGGTEFREEKGGILVCVDGHGEQRVFAGDSNYDSYKTGCGAKLVYSAQLPESNER
ncbi:MAG: leucine-rich repeat protein, partial [Clostridia bacterium]|nr:leucine-rich repeat protein [Clostridia bacterium]